jgi:hypothetical protein
MLNGLSWGACLDQTHGCLARQSSVWAASRPIAARSLLALPLGATRAPAPAGEC